MTRTCCVVVSGCDLKTVQDYSARVSLPYHDVPVMIAAAGFGGEA
jgi:hypothetical protein